jgi:hypothetical protein
MEEAVAIGTKEEKKLVIFSVVDGLLLVEVGINKVAGLFGMFADVAVKDDKVKDKESVMSVDVGSSKVVVSAKSIDVIDDIASAVVGVA